LFFHQEKEDLKRTSHTPSSLESWMIRNDSSSPLPSPPTPPPQGAVVEPNPTKGPLEWLSIDPPSTFFILFDKAVTGLRNVLVASKNVVRYSLKKDELNSFGFKTFCRPTY
jgi:hypothetical protein